MSNEQSNMELLIEAYLDDTLPQPQRKAFEQQARENPRIREQLALQRRIDESLRRTFAVPPSPPEILRQAPISIRRATSRWRWLGLSAAAAAILLIGIAAWYFASPAPQSSSPLITGSKPTLRGQYRMQMHLGFEPMEVCTTPEAFERWVFEKFHRQLRPADTPSDVRFVGWSYHRIISQYTGILLVYVQDQPVVVVMDKTERMTTPPPKGEGPENIFEKEQDGLILYEITPLPEARVLPLLKNPYAG